MPADPSPLPPAVLERLRGYDTPTICNVLELFDVRPRTAGYCDRRIQACFPKLPPMVGYAVTATFNAGSPPRHSDSYAELDEQVKMLAALPKPAIVVFQDLDDPPVAATFGEVMATTYQAFGAAGLVTSGAGRDLDQVERLNFPCFTAGTVGAHGYCQILQMQVPVRVGGLTVYPGDLLHGDRNGLTTIPLDLAEMTVEACDEFMAAESVLLDYLKAGQVEPAGYAAARAECRARLKVLGLNLRGNRPL